MGGAQDWVSAVRRDQHRGHCPRKKIDDILDAAQRESKQGVVKSAGELLAALYHSPNSRKGLAGGVYLAAQLERQNALLEAILKATLRRPI